MIQRINYLRDNGVISFEKVSRDAIRAKREEKWSSLTQVCLFFMGIRMCSNVKWKASKFEDSDTCIYKKKESYQPKIYFRGTNEPFSLSQQKGFSFLLCFQSEYANWTNIFSLAGRIYSKYSKGTRGRGRAGG